MNLRISLKIFAKWLAISSIIGIFAGSASAAFLAALDFATRFRETHIWTITLLPIAGLAIGLTYHHFGRTVEAGSNLLLDEIHEPQKIIPRRMAPLILFSTLVTHFFGGSAGREGTAVQMGGALADRLTDSFNLSPNARKTALMAGMSAGFGSVFGTPLAGAIFGLEVSTMGPVNYAAAFPCLLASFVAHRVTLAWGIHHTPYSISEISSVKMSTLFSALFLGLCFGATGTLFAKTTHGIAGILKKTISWPPLRPFFGGIVVVALAWYLGTTKFLGLGIPTIVDSFVSVVGSWDFLWKFLFTVVTLGSSFKGGEVTPLFFIGATLGHSLSRFTALNLATSAGLGFVAVFAAAANTPLTCAVMATELFGTKIGILALTTCVSAYLFSGVHGIYGARGKRFQFMRLANYIRRSQSGELFK